MGDLTNKMDQIMNDNNMQKVLAMTLVIVSSMACSNGPLKSNPPTAEASGVEAFVGAPAVAQPMSDVVAPLNPYLALERNGIHENTLNSDVTSSPGPIGINPVVTSRKMDALGQACPTLLFDAQGRIITVCLKFSASTLYLLDPNNFSTLASRPIPKKGNTSIFGENDSSGGGYLHFNNLGQVVVPEWDKHIRTYEIDDSGDSPTWVLVNDHDLSDILPSNAHINDSVTDANGRTWFTTSIGLIGYVDEVTGERRLHDFGAGLQNQAAIDETGIYFVLHGFLTKLTVNETTNDIQVLWTSTYDNSAGQSGLLAPGSGTSPTLFGESEPLIAIADNASPQLHLNVYKRTDGALVCSFPIFEPETGGSENSPIGYGNHVVLENNGGFDGLFGDPQQTNTGLTKVTVRDDLSGCDLAWHNSDLRASTTPVLSTATGLIYSYSVKAGSNGADAWFMSTVDWESGQTQYEVFTGSGSQFADMLQPVTLGPDGAFYMSTRNGLLNIRDN